MLSLFRNNQSTTVFLLAIYTVCLRLPALMGWVHPPEKLGEGDGGLLFQSVFGWADKNAFVSAILAAGLVYVQALLVNRLADFNRMMDDRNWLPGALYVLAASCVPDFLFLSPAMAAATFIPIALQRLFSVYRQTQAYAAIFDGAFWVMVTVFFHPPAFWCIGMAYLAYFSLRSFSPKEQFVFLTGMLTPTILALAGYFWFDQADEFLRMQFSRFIFWPSFDLPGDLYGTLKITLLGLLLVAALLGFNVYYHKRLIQIQKYVTILYWFCFAGLLATLFQYDLRPESLMLVMPSMGIFLAYLFQSSRNKPLLELFHLTLFVVVLLLQFFPKF
ncbi:MAG: hypothetical protein JNJ90_07525 [Saprospiraceae bacterium]|jgi:hypothetical protein|nr:hypothetical protein [Saprospiraceae bacterium]